MTQKPLTVIYNDTCPICAREVNGYRRLARRKELDINFIGLSGAEVTQFGLTQRDAARRLHVLEDGALSSGVDAFAVLWARMPGFQWLSRLVRVRGISSLCRLIYDEVLAPALFAMHRRREKRGKARPIP